MVIDTDTNDHIDGYNFLTDEEENKIIRILCNYLSLGQFEMARSLMLQVCDGNTPSSPPTPINTSTVVVEQQQQQLTPSLSSSTASNQQISMTRKISSILHHTIKNGPPSSWLTSDSVPSSPHLQWLCSIEFYNLNREGFVTSISERSLLLVEFAIILYSVLGETANNDRSIVPIIQELREYQCILLNQQSTQVQQQLQQQIGARLTPQCQTLLKRVLVNSPMLSSFIITQLSNPFTTNPSPGSNRSNGMLNYQYPVSAQIEMIVCEVAITLITQGQFKDAYKIISMIDVRDREGQNNNNNIQQQDEEQSTVLTRFLQRLANLNIDYNQQQQQNAIIEDGDKSTLLKIPFKSKLDTNVSDYTKTAGMSRLRIYESLISNKSFYALNKYLSFEEEILKEDGIVDGGSGVFTFPQCFQILKSYQDLKQSNSNAASQSNQVKVMDDFWYWYYHFLRVNNQHFLEYALKVSIDLIKEKRFQEAKVIVKPFKNLLPLIILMCWDLFKDVESKSALTLLLSLQQKDQEKEQQQQGEIEDSNQQSVGYDDLLLHSNKQLSYLVELSKWCCSKMIAIPNSPGGNSLIVGGQNFDIRSKSSGGIVTMEQITNNISNEVISQLTQQSFIYVIKDCLPFITSSDILKVIQDDPDFPKQYQQQQQQQSEMITAIGQEKLNDMNLIRGYYLLKHVLKFFQYRTQGADIDGEEFDLVLEDLEQLIKGISEPSIAIGLIEATYLTLFLSNQNLKNDQQSTPTQSRAIDDSISLSEAFGGGIKLQPTFDSITKDQPSNAKQPLVDLLDGFDNSLKQSEIYKSNSLKRYYVTPNMMASLLKTLTSIIDTQKSSHTGIKESLKERMCILETNIENLKQRLLIINWIISKNINIPFMNLLLMPIQSLLSMSMRTNYPQFEQSIQYFQIHPDIETDILQYQSIPILIDHLSIAEDQPSTLDINNYKGIGQEDLFTILCDIVIGTSGHQQQLNNGLLKRIIELANQSYNQQAPHVTPLKQYIDWVLALHQEYTDTSIYSILAGKNSTTLYPKEEKQLIEFTTKKRNILNAINQLIDNNNNQNNDMEMVKTIIEQDNSLNYNSRKPSTKLLSSTFKYIVSINRIIQESTEFDTSFQNGLDLTKSQDLKYQELLQHLNIHPRVLLERIVFVEKNYKKAERLAKYMKIDLLDFILSSLPTQNSTSTTPSSSSTNNLTIDLINYLNQSSILLSCLTCMLKSPSTSSLSSNHDNEFLKHSIEQSKSLPTSTLGNWINDLMQVVNLVNQQPDLKPLLLNNEANNSLLLNRESTLQPQQTAFVNKIIQQLVSSQQLEAALRVADEFLEDGAPDWLLNLLITNDKQNSFKYIRRVKDHQRCRSLVIELYHNWDVSSAIDMIVLCKIYDQSESSGGELNKLHQCLLIYQSILLIDNNRRWSNWQEIADLCRRDPATMVRQLLDSKHYELARRIRDVFNVANIRNEIEERYLFYLLVEKDDASLTLQTLSALGVESITIVGNLLPKLREVSIKLFLVQFLLSNMKNELNDSKREELKNQETGYKVLLLLPHDLQKEYEGFVQSPSLILEMLLMNEKIPLVAKLVAEIKDLKNDDLLTYYARKALSFNRYMAKNELLVVDDYLQKTQDKNIVNNNNNNNQNKMKDLDGKMVGSLEIYQQHSKMLGQGSPSQLMKERQSKSQSLKWVLSGKDSVEDEKVRHNHFYVRSPSISLAKSLFDLCDSKKKVYQTSLELYNYLSSRLKSSTYSDDNLLIINMIQQLLLYTKLQLLRDPKSGGPTLVAVLDTYLGKVELFQSLVIAKCSGTLTLTDLSDAQKVRQLRDRLISEDRLRLAIDVATKCNIPADPAWVAWGISLIQLGQYNDARDKFKYCLSSTIGDRRVMSPSTSLSPDNVDSSVILNQIIQLLETPPSPNHSNLRSLFNQLSTMPINPKGQLSTKLDDASFYALLQPTTTTSSSGNQGSFSDLNQAQKQPSTFKTSTGFKQTVSIDRQRSLDEAVYYIKKYGNGRMHINFLMKHDMMELACKTILSDNLPLTIFFEEIVVFNIQNSSLPELFSIIKTIDPKLNEYQEHLLGSCKIMNERKWYSILFEFQLYMNDHIRAGLTCIKMFISSVESPAATRLHHLEQAQHYFQLGSNQRGVLPEMELLKYLQNTSTQIEVSKYLYAQKGVPASIHKLSVFGSPKQKAELTEYLTVMNNFELGFKLAMEFKLELPPIYTSALTTMSRKKNYSKVEEILGNLKNFIDPSDWDTIAMPVLETMCNEMKEFKVPEKFITKLNSPHNCIRICILCNKLKTAYLKAVQLQDRNLIQLVMDEAQRTNQQQIYKYCQEVLNNTQ